MEQLIKQESQKQIAKQMRQARIRRQIQVRQQAMAWTETVRKKYDEAKEQEIKHLAEAVTEEAQNTAIENIRHLTTLHDLAMADIGMAHRAAAGYQNVEKLRSLKRLKDEEVAKNRGTAAMMKVVKEKESKTASSVALLKRKEEVRKAEDKKSKEMISRRPLSITNSTVDSRSKPVILGPPDYQPSLAKTLRVVSDTKSLSGPSKQTKSGKLKIHQSKSQQRTPQKSASQKTQPRTPQKSAAQKSQQPNKSTPHTKHTDRNQSERLALISKTKRKDSEEHEKPKEGALKRMVRIKVSEPQRKSGNVDFARIKFEGKDLNLRESSNDAYEQEVVKPATNTVRYYDDALPKGEVKYIAPDGLAVKETRTSPDAWEKGRTISSKLQEEHEKKAELEDLTAKKVEERGRLALKKARLEKQLNQVRSELLEGIGAELELMGTGSQKAILGLDDFQDKALGSDDDDGLSDEFSAVESDEEFNFTPTLPPQRTLKSYTVAEDQADKHLMLVPTSKDDTSSPPDEASSLDSFGSYSSPSLHSEKNPTTKEYYLEPLRPASVVAVENEDDKYYNRDPIKSDSPKSKILSESTSTLEKMAGSLIPHTVSDPDATAVSDQLGRKSIDSTRSRSNRNSREDIVSTESRTSSGSTLAEINIKTTSGDTTTGGRKTDSLEDLQTRAEEQENLLRKAHPPARQTSKGNVNPDELEKKNNLKTSPDSTIISVSSKGEDGKKSIDESTNGLTSSNSSDDTSILVNIKLRESTDSTPSRSEQSSVSTDYYNPPDGPFTSTPDGKLHPKRSSRSNEKSFDLVKKRTLYHYVDKFLAKKPESIENLQISTSSSSLIRADSNVLTSDSFEATFTPASHSRSGTSSSSSKSSTSSSPASNQLGSSFQAMPLAPVSEEDSEFDSGSTIAETAIKAALGTSVTSESNTSSNDKSDSRSETKDTVSTSDSLTYMLGALSAQQAIEKRQLEMLESEEEEETNSHDQVSATLPNQLDEPDPRNLSRRSSRSSSGSFPDASLILRELRSRHKRKSPNSKSSDGSPKSGPEREAERVELLEDITPVKLWETPPNFSVRSETEQLSEVFDKLIDKWANIRIEPPPWWN